MKNRGFPSESREACSDETASLRPIRYETPAAEPDLTIHLIDRAAAVRSSQLRPKRRRGQREAKGKEPQRAQEQREQRGVTASFFAKRGQRQRSKEGSQLRSSRRARGHQRGVKASFFVGQRGGHSFVARGALHQWPPDVVDAPASRSILRDEEMRALGGHESGDLTTR